ncbi:filamentous hemagglutinin [Pseudomonas nitritireducens]|uniref:Filamentous hemagglutinin n=1 Tax=Pseudomonas nitroreducens TaxID=46680 RepID=A0A7W7P278_PSENT|nr:filamentous hemagglutinin N-terminal domain-containing protein [Pseudomonas nitritireducens]MBB4864037.1 filamentous hemagglutinin [Pseudomonas nitritireducens]
MDFRHPLNQAIASVLTGILFLNPIVVAGAQLAVDAAAGGNTQIGAAGNGVPIVNIATPNGAGLSHNKFTDYNVGQQGLILNNATGKTQSTQLGGMIIGNPNLKGQAAQKILNEVTGSNPSHLRGYTEVAGQAAHVIVANPHGIACAGCGVINTPRATLTTGKPIINGGQLQGYDVNGGHIAIEGTGLNASNVDRFELITRSVQLNAELHANQLAVVAGRNQVDAESLAATAKADDGSAKPQLAIDSSTLGGMYAGAIRLVGTEQGVGVKLAGNMAASAGDIQIDANGQLSLAQTSAAGSLRARAQDIALTGPAYAGNTAELSANGQLSNSQSLAAGQRVALTAAQVSNSGIVEAGVNPDSSRNAQGDVAINAQILRNSGSVVASRNLDANASAALDNQGGALKAAEARVSAATLDNRQGRLLASGQLSLNAARLDNRNGQAVANRLQVSGGVLDNRLGLFSAEQSLDFTLDSLDNSGKGTLVSNGTLQARVQQKLDNQADGLLSAKGALGVQAGNLDNRGGLVVGDAGVTLSGASLSNSALGVISSLGELKIDVGQLDNSQGGTLDSGAALRLNASQVNNAKGSVTAKGDLQAKADSFSQQGGELLAQGALNLEAGQLDNRNGGLVAANNGVTVNGTDLLNQGGEISSRAKVELQAASLENGGGKVVGDAGLSLQVQRIANRAGTLAGRDGLSVTGQSLDNSQGGLLSSQKSLWLQLAGALDNSGNGALLSQGVLTLNAGSLDNRGGAISSAGLLFSRLAGDLDNRGGKLLSDGAIDLGGASLNNAGGILSAAGDINLQGAKLDNSQKGRIVTDAAIHLATAQLDNSQGGSLSARGVIDGRVSGLDQHSGGQLIGQGGIDLDLQGGALNNAGGLLGSPGQLVLRNVASLDNQGGEISSDRTFALTTGTLLNQGGKILSGDRLTLTSGALNNSNAGVLSGTNGLSVSATSLDNSQGGTLASRGDLLVRSQGALDNHDDGALVAGGKLDVGSASLHNQGGLLSATGNLLLITGTTDNREGRLLAQGNLDSTTADLDNRDGVISGAQGLELSAGNVLNGASAAGKPGGLITSQGALTLHGGKLESTNGGEISAKGDLHLIVAQLIQRQAALIGEGKVTLDLGNGARRGDFDNRGGLLSASGALQINGLGNLDNRGGEISASQDFTLTASGDLDNRDSGRIISAGQLELNAGALRNANQGLLSGWQGLVVNADSLDNSSGGTVSSRDGALNLTLSGALDNHGEGALVSKGNLSLGAGSLNNAGGIVSTQGNLGLSLAGGLDNSAAGLLSAQGSLTGRAGAVDNRGGQISAASVDYDASSLNNSGGSLVSQGALRLGLLGALLNNGVGSKLASGGALNLKVGNLENRGGQLASQGLLKVLAGRFDNSLGGTVAAQNDLTLELTAELLNDQDGLLFSKVGQLNVSANSIDNAGGTLQGQGNTTLKATGAIGNQNGHIISQNGQLDLGSGSLDNSAEGVINAANGNLKLVTGQFSNNAGTTQAKAVNITATGGIDNRSGHLSAVSGDNRVSTTDLNNQGGGLYAGGLLYLRGNQLFNDGAALGLGGKIGAGNLDASLTGALNNQFGLIESSGNLTLGAVSIDSQNGRLRALGKAGATAIKTTLLDNRNGALETANENLSLTVDNLLNEGGRVFHVGNGTFGLNATDITRAGGSFITTGRFDITADSWTNSSVLQAGWLSLNIGQFNQTSDGALLANHSLTGRGGNWSNDGLLASDGSLDIQLTGTYSGAGRVTSLGDLHLSANQLNVNPRGSITGGQDVTLAAAKLTNLGRITAAGDLIAGTGTLNNYGTFGSAGQLQIQTGDLLNDGQAQGALLFSGADMILRVDGTLTNRLADVYSLGDLDVAANDAAARTAKIENLTGHLEAAGDLSLLGTSIVNRKDQFAIGQKLVSGYITVRCYDCGGDHYNVDYILKEWYEGGIEESTSASTISAGRDLTLAGDDVQNIGGVISAAHNIAINAQNFLNQGVGSGSAIRTLTFASGRITDGTFERFLGNVVLPYNAANHPDPTTFFYLVGEDFKTGTITPIELQNITLHAYQDENGKVFRPDYVPDWDSNTYDPNNVRTVPEELYRYGLVSDIFEYRPGGAVSNAVVQAAGDISINASQRLENSVVLPGIRYEGGVPKLADTTVSGKTQPIVVVLDRKLPPELAQQQVNPISLPGFSLPTGSNGLFRLSADEGNKSATQAVAGANSFTFTGQSIGPNQRERALSGDLTQVSDVSLTSGGNAQDAVGEGSFGVARVQGVPSSASPSNSHKYLIETNPELTNLKSFLGSDYLLGLLGYDPDQAQKRLGDGLYEQRLIRDAVVARTGQRYIDGMTSDEALFKYLMDNAIAYKDSLKLSVGVALTAEQVAALTHDIVWLEEAEVNGEKVLVPVVYLAQANNRLAPSGALIMGSDVSLIAGGDLTNQGTLRASGDLSVTAKNIQNSGAIEASGRLDLLAQDSIKNAQGGIISGRDVSLSTLTGDVINERSVAVHEGGVGSRGWTQSFDEGAARIEAAGSLSINAGRDLNNIGGSITSGSDLELYAGRDVNLLSVELEKERSKGRNYQQSTSQLGNEVSAGRDLDINAGRDLTAIASRIDAARDAAINAGRNVSLISAADEQHSYDKTKKVTKQEDHVEQQSTALNAGGDVLISAGEDLTLVSSKIVAGNEAYLVAGDKIKVLAANDTDYSLYDKKSKGSWGRKKTQHDEVTDVEAVRSEIRAGSDITLISGGDQIYQGAKLESGNDITIVSGGSVTFEAVKDLHQESHAKSDSDLSWSKSKGEGKTDETLRQSALLAQGELTIRAVEGLKIDYKHINKQSVSQAIDAMVKADPNLAWIKEAEARGDVDWRAVKEIHDSYSFSNSGIGAGAQLAIAIVMTAVVGPAAMGALTTAGAGTAVAAGGAAVAVGASTNATVSFVNNKGNLGDVLKDTTSSDALKGYAISGITAGLTADYFGKLTGTSTDSITGKITFTDPNVTLGSFQGLSQFAAKQALQNGTAAALGKILGQDGSLGDALKATLYNTLAAASFNAVGDYTKGVYDEGSIQKILIHAMVGGLLAEASGGDFRTGALAGGANEALVDQLNTWVGGNQDLLTMTSQLVGVLAAATQKDADINDLNTGKWVAENATQYNYLSHVQEELKKTELEGCKEKVFCKTGVEAKWAMTDAMQDVGIVVGVGGGIGLSAAETAEGLFQLATHLPETMDALRLLANSPEFRQQFGDNYFQDLEARANHLTNAYNDAGWQGSVTAGVEGGRFAAELVGVLTAVRGGAKVASELPTAAKNVINAIAEMPASGSKAGQIGAVGDIGKLAGDAAKGAATWKGSGPVPGVLGVEPGSVSSKAIQNYYPSTKSGSIEFVFDTKTQTFVVGKPSVGSPGLSPHEQLAKSINSSDSSAVVGGMFRRGPNGEFITNEFSGHYWQNWTPETRSAFEKAMSGYGVKVEHRPGM